MDRMQIMWGGLHFQGGEEPATYTIERGGITGLLAGGSGFRRQETSRPSAHGDFDSRSYRTGRRISWGGLVLTDSGAEQEHAIRRLEAVASSGNLSQITFESGSNPLWGMFGSDSEIDVRVETYGAVARYKLGVYAPDPLMFGEVRSYAAGVPAVHYGNFPALPELTVTGPHPAGYTVSAGSSQFTVTTPLASGSTDVIDMSTGWVRRNGVLLVGGVSVADTWTVPPGLPGVVHSLTGGSGSLTVRVTDTFI